VKKIYLSILVILMSTSLFAQHLKSMIPEKEVTVIYLGHSGWAVRVNNNFLIFDYQKIYDYNWKQPPEKNLLSGYINPNEIENYNVYVFVSHEHSDHYDPVILEWEKEIENITYFFGWGFSPKDQYNCLKELRSHYVDENIEIHTINSAHSGVFESAFLVQIDGLTIYHNGDYMGDYDNDYTYLKTKTERIDLAFSNGVAIETAKLFKQSVLLMNELNVEHFFPMHSINKEYEFKTLSKMLEKRQLKAKIHCVDKPGDRFKL